MRQFFIVPRICINSFQYISDTASDGSEPNTVSIRREIPIRDYNDNTPQFIGRPYRSIISESAKIGDELMITPPVIVTDADDGLNADCLITCSSSGHICDTFGIRTVQIAPGNFTAKITLRKMLDFETQPSYVLTLTARDNALVNKLSSQASISISVIDVQDQIPVFVNAPYSATINENTPADTEILTITAHDGDTQNPRPLKMVLENDYNNHFKLIEVSNGKAILKTTNNHLDREDTSIIQNGGIYTFNVTAIEIANNRTTEDLARTQVTVVLIDEDDNLPTFNKQELTITIPENLEKSTPLPGLAIVVNDPDLGENSDYSLSLRNVKNSEGVFEISPRNGHGRTPVVVKVINNEKLDFDIPVASDKEFIFDIMARVRGQEVSYTRITVQLEDVNDNVPVFNSSSLTIEVREDVESGTKVADIQATDRDSGKFKEISYILKGFGSENFYTDIRTGGVYVKKKLDYEQQKSYSMTLVAIDGGQRETNLNLFINVLDVNDNHPIFELLEYTRTIREGAINFEPQFYVHATDIDGPTQGGGRLLYTIDSENSISGHEFTIDSETGEIKIVNRVSSMDTERGQYELIVSARDYGEPPLSNNTRIVIRVGISGNQRPIFKNILHSKPQEFPGPIPYKVFLPENAKPGDNVTQISATDPDGIDALIEYKILGANDNFEIEPHSGLIKVSSNARFDRDRIIDHYNVVVVAIDAGFPFPETATTTALVTITDVNDEPPKFEKSYSTYVSERTEIGSEVIIVRAFDPDLDANLSYAIIEPITASSKSGLKLSSESLFEYKHALVINQTTGAVTLNRTLNSNVVSVIVVTIQVTDLNAMDKFNAQMAITELTIYIQSFKEIDPVFLNPGWTSMNPVINQRIMEETTIGKPILTLTAQDPESLSRIQNFKMLENDPRKFVELQEHTGDIIVTQRIDYEMLDSPYFNITVQAINPNNNRHSIAVVNFTVENINDNEPIFSSKVYRATIMESAKYPAKVANVMAIDADKVLTSEDTNFGYNQITYSLLGQYSQYFIINSTTGEINVAPNQTLDREEHEELHFKVQAEDAPNQPIDARKTISDVIVTLLDVNDNAPQFTMKSYSAVVPENVPRKTFVAKITATDPDEGSDISYDFFNEGEASGLLTIDHMTGMIYTKAELTGKGRADPYDLVVRAQDNGNVSPNQELFYTDVPFTLYIGDISSNDGVPFFISPKLGQVTNITENSPIDTPIFQVVASDPDSPSTPSGMLYYQIQNNTEDAHMFKIDPRSGLVVSTTSFDRETKSVYNIIIEVKDRGEPPLTVSRVLEIHVLDVDDHKPRFEREISNGPLQFSIQEEQPIGTIIANISAIDEDILENGAIDYVIISGNQEDHFYIERTMDNRGLLKSNIKLDRENQSTYLLAIKCYKYNDTRPRNKDYNPKELSEIQLIVNVMDIDDHLPQFKPNISEIGIRHNVGVDSLITTIFATDEDSESIELPMTYNIEKISYTPQFYKRNIRNESWDNLFSLNNETGELRTANSVQDFVDGFFSISISAKNSHDPSRLQNTTLKLFIIRDKSLLRFVFAKPPIEVRTSISDFNKNVESKLKPSALELHTFNPEALLKSDHSLDFTSTSVCFQLSRHGSAIPPQQMEKILNGPDILGNLTEVYVNYSVTAIEPCSTAKRNVSTSGGWSNHSGILLVVLAALIGLIALIATCVSGCLLKK